MAANSKLMSRKVNLSQKGIVERQDPCLVTISLLALSVVLMLGTAGNHMMAIRQTKGPRRAAVVHGTENSP